MRCFDCCMALHVALQIRPWVGKMSEPCAIENVPGMLGLPCAVHAASFKALEIPSLQLDPEIADNNHTSIARLGRGCRHLNVLDRLLKPSERQGCIGI